MRLEFFPEADKINLKFQNFLKNCKRTLRQILLKILVYLRKLDSFQ